MDRRGWTYAEWDAMTIDEQERAMAWETQRTQMLREGLERAMDRSTTDDGKRYPETVIANLMLEMANVI